MVQFNVIEIQPTKTYANAANAEKAVRKWAERFDRSTRAGRDFNVFIMPTADGRCFPVLCNISQSFLHVAIHSGFNLVN